MDLRPPPGDPGPFETKELLALLDAISAGVMVQDTSHQVLHINDAAALAMGFSSTEELPGTSLQEIWNALEVVGEDGQPFPVDSLPSCLVLSGEIASSVTLRFVSRKTGNERWSQVTARPVFEQDGAIKYAVSVITDVTQVWQAQEAQRQSEESLRVALQNSHFVPAQFDKDLRYTWIYNVHPDFDVSEVVGKRDDELESSTGAKQLTELKRQVVETGAGIRREIAFQRSDGIRAWDFTIEPLCDAKGEVVGGTSAAFEITARKQAYEALGETEEIARRRADELAAALEAVPGIVFIAHDTEGKLITGSKAAHDFLRIPPGSNLSKSMPESGADAIFGIYKNGVEIPDGQLPVQRAARGEVVEGEEVEHRFFDGESRYIFGNARPLFDDEGRPRGAVAAFVDVTARREAEETLAKERADEMTAFMDAVPVIVLVAHDSEASYVTGNAATYKLFRLPDGGNLSKTANLSGRLDHYRITKNGVPVAPEESPLRRAARGQPTYSEEFEVRFSDDAVVYIFGNAVPLFDPEGRPRGSMSTYIDISELKRAEATIREANETLEQRVNERTTELAALNERLRLLANELTETEQRERQRLAALLHDHVQQMLVAVKMRIAGLSRIVEGQQASTLVSQADELIGEAMEVSRTLTAELRPPALYESGMIAALRWLAERMEKTHGLKVLIDADKSAEPPVDKGGSLLFESVRELILNTVKYAGVSECSVTLERAPDNCVCVTVRDHGAGFDLSEISDSDSDGSFGIFSIRERLRVLGGKMEIESAPGSGATIRLFAPLSPPDLDAVHPGTARQFELDGVGPLIERQSGTDRITVLLADDHDIVRRGVATLLKAAQDIEVVAEVGDGAEAVEAARRLRPDVALLDVNMPIMNGIEAARQIRDGTPGVQIIGLSVHADHATRQAMLDSGASAYLPKDSPPESLIAAVRELSASKRGPV